ncbi:MAG: caffeoyl-CoA O-methyltransferase [Candidatus Binatota bacterium]|jgi:caffeoyl-CoA O-methyltransferase|nr:caffeoyl-CoA O-methyltransferase [Candidatus Binatota bacterium]
MPDKFTSLTPELYRYLLDHSVRPDPVLERLREETAALGRPAVMQIAPDEGALLTLFVRAICARRAIEIGTFTGYSSIAIARGLPPDGRLVTCDVNEEWTRIARRYFREAGVAERIELRLGPALDTLASLDRGESFDFAFVDADKSSYPAYYEAILERLRPGGVLMIDNVLWGGRVVDPSDTSEATRAIRALNDRIAVDERVDAATLPVADGVTIARRR